MAQTNGEPGGLFADFPRRARGLGLTQAARQLDVFLRLPAEQQDSCWFDLAARVDRERREAGLVT